ncbi:MAG: hypothetical protein RIQ52_1972 [Pseudomonadota bacterium]|jgi:hypothetical protein
MAHVHNAVRHVNHGGHAMTQHAVTAAKVVGMAAAGSATAHSGGIMKTLTRNPLIVFAAGVAAGFFIHKYRKEIIASASSISDAGRDYMMHQKENLEDLLEEQREEAEEDAGQGPGKRR